MQDLTLTLGGRAMCALVAANNAPSWLIGTTSLRNSNEVLVVELDNEKLRVTSSFDHGHGEVWSIDAAPTNSALLGTVWRSTGGKSGATLWQAQHLSGKAKALQDLSPTHSSRVHQLQWNPQDSSCLLTLEDVALHSWHLREASAEVAASSRHFDTHLAAAAWDPNSSQRICMAEGSKIQVWDMRQRSVQLLVQHAHSLPIRHLDFARQQQDCLCSCGDDGRIRIWDLRGGKGPLLDLAAHDHWVWRATFHPAYDNLLLSCSSDSTCALWHINLAAATAQKAGAATPIASKGIAGGAASKAAVAVAAGGRAVAAAGAAAAKPQPTSRGGPPALRLQQSSAQDSVYAAAWSTAVDPWVYVSLCIDGRLALHKVPNSTKYKLLAGG